MFHRPLYQNLMRFENRLLKKKEKDLPEKISPQISFKISALATRQQINFIILPINSSRFLINK